MATNDSMDENSDAAATLALKVSDAADADVILYNGPIERGVDLRFIRLVKREKLRTNAILILVTQGGNADAAYRIARCLQKNYEKFSVFVSGFCKSAGTLLTLGAHEVIFSDYGELGPLDVQFTKKDELWQANSALTVIDALDTLQYQALEMFERYFLQIKSRSDDAITFRTATDIAAELTVGLFTPIYQQIDPMYVGEAGRSLKIAQEYGDRLVKGCQNFDTDTAVHLISHYPSHSFVIEREEAEGFFENVRIPTDDEEGLCEQLGNLGRIPRASDETIIEFLSVTRSAKQTAETRAIPGGRPDAIYSRDSASGASETGQEASKPLGSAEKNEGYEPSPEAS